MTQNVKIQLLQFLIFNYNFWVNVLFLDRERFALGTEDGLFVVEVTRDRESEKRVDVQLFEMFVFVHY